MPQRIKTVAASIDAAWRPIDAARSRLGRSVLFRWMNPASRTFTVKELDFYRTKIILDMFTVEQHVRGKWACRQCETLIQAPVPAQVIDKGIPTAGLLAHVMVAKFADHLPLYRQEKIFGRAGPAIARSTLAQWVGQTGVRLQPLVDALREAVLNQGVIHADETPVQMLTPGEKKTHRAYVWAHSTTPFSALKAVVYDFSPSRAGEHARNFLDTRNGKLVCDGG